MPTLAELNALLETSGQLSGDVWTEWLWRSNPEEPLHPKVLLNKSQLLGLLVCRHQAKQPKQTTVAVFLSEDSTPETEQRIRLLDKDPSNMTLRELQDTIQNICIEWPKFLARLDQNPNAQTNLRMVLGLVDGCFARFGWLAATPCTQEIMDDPSHTEEHTSTTAKLTLGCIRRCLGTFLVLYRHLDLLARHIPVEPVFHDCKIRKHHMEASTEDFHLLCMHMLLPVAGRLNYKQDFPGMYNHVSQAMYFHDAQYERTNRVKLERVPEGDPMHILPALCQIQPEIPLHYEEDAIDLSSPIDKWIWMVLAGRVYLIDPSARVYYSSNITALMRVYMAERDP